MPAHDESQRSRAGADERDEGLDVTDASGASSDATSLGGDVTNPSRTQDALLPDWSSPDVAGRSVSGEDMPASASDDITGGAAGGTPTYPSATGENGPDLEPSGTDATGGAGDTSTDYVEGRARGG